MISFRVLFVITAGFVVAIRAAILPEVEISLKINDGYIVGNEVEVAVGIEAGMGAGIQAETVVAAVFDTGKVAVEQNFLVAVRDSLQDAVPLVYLLLAT